MFRNIVLFIPAYLFRSDHLLIVIKQIQRMGDHVDKAMKRIMASRAWTTPQRNWLERIGQQLKTEVIVDQDAFDRGAFKAQGGEFERLNRTFEGRLQEIPVDINKALWQEAS